MAERTTSEGTNAEQESASEATPVSAARLNKSAADEGSDTKPEGVAPKAKPEVKTAADIVAEAAARKRAEEEAAKAESAPATAQKTAVKPPANQPARQSGKPVGTPDSKGKAALSAVGSGVSKVRNVAASLVWLVAVACAGVLALGALFTALDQANESNEIVSWVLDRCHDLVGPFDEVFKLETAKNTLLVNWAIAALAYLVVGKIAERIIRP
jgi:hypothetical protein